MTLQSVPHFECEVCRFSLFHPIGRLSRSWLGLYDDHRFPGRCLLVFDEHVENFAQLNPSDLLSFTSDMQTAALAIQRATQALRMNYAILGNTEPHLHAHLIPRTGADPVPLRSPWNHPEKAHSLQPQKLRDMQSRIAFELGHS